MFGVHYGQNVRGGTIQRLCDLTGCFVLSRVRLASSCMGAPGVWCQPLKSSDILASSCMGAPGVWCQPLKSSDL